MSENGHRRELAFDLPAAHRTVRVARNLARRFARMEGVNERDVDSMLLVLSELLANAVDHGGGEAAMEGSANGTRMRAVVQLDDDRWTVRVVDEGGGDPEAIRAVLESDGMPDLEDERGRGFFLMKELTDDLSVELSESGRGLTILAMRHYKSD